MRSFGISLLFLAACSPQSQKDAATAPPEPGVYDPDPSHLWNRLHRALFVRTAPDGKEWGYDRADPFLCRGVVEAPERRALDVFDEFLEKGVGLVRDPLKRAVLQHDLWATFDGTVSHEKQCKPDDPLNLHLRALRARLQVALRRLALTVEEVDKLPDTYALAVASREFGDQYDPARPEAPFLPSDLFQPEGPWICLRSGVRDEPLAIQHAAAFSGTSTFLILLRLPGGRKAGIDFLELVNERGKFVKEAFDVDLPPLPAGTQVALVRQMMIVDVRGEIVPTRITEEVQIRVHRGHVVPQGSAQGTFPQEVYSFIMTRANLFRGKAGGLRARGRAEEDVAAGLFSNRHLDFSEDLDIEPKFRTVRNGSMVTHLVLQSCAGCHSYPTWRLTANKETDRSTSSIWSIGRNHSGGTALPITPAESDWEFGYTRDWKKNRADWGLLQGLWEASDAPSRDR
jgi:hypothetical protein